MNIENGLLTVLIIQLIKLSQSNKEDQIRKLEKEKDELFIQIQKGIADSIKTLRNDNDTEAVLGVTYLKELGKQIKELNETEDLNKTNTNEVRRNFEDARRNKPKLNLADIAYLFTTKSHDSKKIKEDNRVVLQKKLNEWIKQREEEKAKIKDYKKKIKGQVVGRAKAEKCPRFGIGNAQKKHDDGLEQKSKKNKKAKYPCCRKCCKKSYLGCL